MPITAAASTRITPQPFSSPIASPKTAMLVSEANAGSRVFKAEALTEPSNFMPASSRRRPTT